MGAYELGVILFPDSFVFQELFQVKNRRIHGGGGPQQVIADVDPGNHEKQFEEICSGPDHLLEALEEESELEVGDGADRAVLGPRDHADGAPERRGGEAFL